MQTKNGQSFSPRAKAVVQKRLLVYDKQKSANRSESAQDRRCGCAAWEEREYGRSRKDVSYKTEKGA